MVLFFMDYGVKMAEMERMYWSIIIKTVFDEERANQMVKIANLRFKFWDNWW